MKTNAQITKDEESQENKDSEEKQEETDELTEQEKIIKQEFETPQAIITPVKTQTTEPPLTTLEETLGGNIEETSTTNQPQQNLAYDNSPDYGSPQEFIPIKAPTLNPGLTQNNSQSNWQSAWGKTTSDPNYPELTANFNQTEKYETRLQEPFGAKKRRAEW